MQPRAAGALAGRGGLGAAHRRNAGARSERPARRPAGTRTARRPQGGGRAPDAHRPDPARPRLAVAPWQRARARVPQRREVQPRDASGERGPGPGAAGTEPGRGGAGHFPRRHHHGRAQTPGDAGHRCAGTVAARLVHRQPGPHQRREGRAEYPDPHGGLRRHRAKHLDGERAVGGRHRDRLGPGARDPRDGPQGPGAAGSAVGRARTGARCARPEGRPAVEAARSDQRAAAEGAAAR